MGGRALLVALAVVVAGGGCSGDDGGPTVASTTTAGPEDATEAFVSGICGAATTFAGQAQSVDQAMAAGGDLHDAISAYTTSGEVADQLVSQVSAVPAPGVEGGEEIKAEAVAAYQDLADFVDAVAADLRAVTDADGAAADQAVADAGRAVAEALNDVNRVLAGLPTQFPDAADELRAAFAHEHSCENLVTE